MWVAYSGLLCDKHNSWFVYRRTFVIGGTENKSIREFYIDYDSGYPSPKLKNLVVPYSIFYKHDYTLEGIQPTNLFRLRTVKEGETDPQ